MESSDIAYLLVRLVTLLAGAFVVVYTVLSAIRTFVLPRPAQVLVFRLVFLNVRRFFDLRARRTASYEERDQVMALYAPIALFLVPVALMTLVMIGFMAVYWALSPLSIIESFKLSGSSLLTLGSFTNDAPRLMVFEFAEALLGMIMVALLIAYLPTIYNAFTRRETQVQLLEVRAGTPPSPWELIARSHRTGELDQLHEFWSDWQVWFAEIEESHTSLAALAFFRSPRPELSWITAAGVVLDAAALMLSTVDIRREPRAAFCIRSGYLALRHIAIFFEVPSSDNPAATDPIAVTRHEYEEACRYLTEQGVPLLPDRVQTWRDYAGWRVNYDKELIALAALTMAPYAPWSSDRSLSPTTRRRMSGEEGKWE
ncbi:MAG: hypothetical protein KA586_10585 [Candidatus Promineofilum sp.]|nr:hypothetical protein [Promineifilum sp.]